MPQTSTLRAYARDVSVAHKRRLIGSYRAPYRPASTGTEPDDMKVDSPGRDMNAKDVIAFAESAIEDDDDDDVAVQGMTQDEDDEEPPYKRICRGKESRLSQALTETGNMR